MVYWKILWVWSDSVNNKQVLDERVIPREDFGKYTQWFAKSVISKLKGYTVEEKEHILDRFTTRVEDILSGKLNKVIQEKVLKWLLDWEIDSYRKTHSYVRKFIK